MTTQVTTDAETAFDGSLLRASLLANDHLAVLEADRLAQLRALTDTLGVAEAVSTGNRRRLTELLGPIVANGLPTHLQVRVLGRQGTEIFALGGAPFPGTAALRAAPVSDSLRGRRDSRGDRYIFVDRGSSPAATILYWVGPVRSDSQQVVGAILLGQPLADIASGIRGGGASELAFFDENGRVLSSSLREMGALTAGNRRSITPGAPVRLNETLQGHRFSLLVSDWTMRGSQRLGYFAVALDASGLNDSVTRVRLLLLGLFVGAALITLLLGAALATRITRPLERLVRSMRIVSGGDLSHRAPVGPPDEIGYLTRSFNEMTASLKESYFGSMEALARAIDARDPYTFGHSSRVAAYSLEIATALDLAPEARESLRRAALLHDIGKIGVEDRILHKAGPLSPQESDQMRKHALIGHDVLKGLRFLGDSLAGVRHHHERWDGTGYPDGLKGERIPLAVRIITVADTFDALTSDRPYRGGLSFGTAIDVITTSTGQFDPAVVRAFVSRADVIMALLDSFGSLARERRMPAMSGVGG